ncbi:hypothetical protein, partial [Treponema saccharophilum]|uniref:hypothetical protein n=1 Tax=Treponema saccharophilum TaxID=165 RepID=UPI00386D4476
FMSIEAITIMKRIIQKNESFWDWIALLAEKSRTQKKNRSTGVTVVLRAHGARVVFRVFTIYLLERAHATPAKRECAFMGARGKAFFSSRLPFDWSVPTQLPQSGSAP